MSKYKINLKKYLIKLGIGLPIVGASIGGATFGLNFGMKMLNENRNAINSNLFPSETFISEADKESAKASGLEFSKEIIRDGSVLLKNSNNILPLDKTLNNKVNVYGHGSIDWIVGGSGSGQCETEIGVPQTFILDALTDYGIEYNHDLSDYYTNFKGPDKTRNSLGGFYDTFYQLVEPRVSDYTGILNSSKTFSDTALVVLGRRGGESEDPPRTQFKYGLPNDTSRHTLQISTEEEELLKWVGANQTNVIVVINSLNTFEMSFLDTIPGLDACLYIGGTGTSGALAIPELLYGDYSPSGRLSDTIPYDFKYNINYNHAGMEMVNHYTNGEATKLYPYNITGRNAGVSQTKNASYIDYLENIYVGYKWFETADAEGYWDIDPYNGYDTIVQYPFGFGMSYTNFKWEFISSNPELGSSIVNTDKITLKVKVTNTGTCSGKDVVQAYLTAPYTDGGIEKSYVSLVGVAKTAELEPSASQELTLTLTVADFESYDCYDANANGHRGYELEQGAYQIKLMSDAHHFHKVTKDETELEKCVLTYNVAETIKVKNDEITGNPVKNLFTREKENDNLPDVASVDGLDDGVKKEDIVSRSNFPALSTEKTPDRAISEKGRYFNLYTKSIANQWDNATTDVCGNDISNLQKPKFGYGTTPKLFDGKEATQLGLELGKDYNDPRWESLLDSIPFSEAYNLSGKDNVWHEQALPSIGHTAGFQDYDGPAQVRAFNGGSDRGTGYPNSTVLAQTFSPVLSYKYGFSYGNDMDAKSVDGIYGFGCNIHRSPFQGRNYEYLSEDGFLSGLILQNEIKGLSYKGKYTFLKHLCLAENEYEREATYVWVTEQALREIYLKPFKMAIQNAGCVGIMSSYNRIGGNWTGSSEALVTGVLRNEWGFKGAIITDYSDHKQYMIHEGSFRAGGNMGMATSFSNGFGGFNESASPRLLQRLRDSTHQIIYMWLYPRYMKSIYDPSQDDFGAPVKSFSINGWDWITPCLPILFTLVYGGLGVSFYFVARPKLEKVEEGESK